MTPTQGEHAQPEALRAIQRFEVVDCIDSNHVPAVVSTNGAESNMTSGAAIAAGAAPTDEEILNRPASECGISAPGTREYDLELIRWYERRRASHGQAPAQPEAVLEINRLRAALVYVAFALHGTRQYMLAEGITLIDGDTVRVSRDGWTVEASINPARVTPPAQAADSVLEDAARDHIRALIAQHADILKQNESAYFELCYHRATGWMAWITDKPLCMPPVVSPDRKVLAQGQGDTPDEACADAARNQGGSHD